MFFGLRWLSLLALTFNGTLTGGVRFLRSNNDAAIVISDRVAYYDNIYPRAIYLASQQKTYFTYHCDSGTYDRCVGLYDHVAKTLTTKKVLVNPDSDKGDSHGNPCLIDDENGNILMISAPHVGAYSVYKNDTVGSIASWTLLSTFGSGHTYPQASRNPVDQDIYVITRQTGTEDDLVFYKSTDNGTTWSTKEDVISAQASDDSLVYSYSRIDSTGKLHVFFHYFEGAHTDPIYDTFPREDLYYLYRATDGNWKNMAGDTLTLPLVRAGLAALKIYESSGNHTHLKRPVVDSAGKPYIVFTEAASAGGSPVSVNEIGTVKLTHWTGSAWETHTVTTSTRESNALDIDANDALYVYDTTSNQSILRELKSTDHGGSWSFMQNVYNRGQTRRINKPMLVDNYHANAKLIWYGYHSTTGNDGHFNLWGAQGQIGNDGAFIRE